MHKLIKRVIEGINTMLFTVIIATYNSGKVIDDCLKSIANQSYLDKNEIELIVIDGASTDNTLDILKDYSYLISILISEKDNGVYDAWNKGLKCVNGDWILFLGSDDKLLPQSLIKYATFLSKLDDKPDLVSSRVQLVDSDTTKIKVIGEKYDWNVFRKRMNIAHVGSLHSAKLFHELGSYDSNFRICGDYELLLRKRERLNAEFMDEVTVDMMVGGLSYSSTSAIYETYIAKKTHFTCNPISTYASYSYLLLKHYIKKALQR